MLSNPYRTQNEPRFFPIRLVGSSWVLTSAVSILWYYTQNPLAPLLFQFLSAPQTPENYLVLVTNW
jgi:hypothetical protein